MRIIAEKYQVIRTLGSGGSGTVYLVRHVHLGTTYALKLLRPSSSEEDCDIARFKREASLLQSFSHSGSVQFRDFGLTEDGQYYMTTDYADGGLLLDLVNQCGAFEVSLALEIVQQMLDVLQAAHEAGIIHRDVKPENVIIEGGALPDLRVKLLDFGIAKLQEHVGCISGVTQKGLILGTPEFMSPEQAAGESDLDHRADIYAAGILLYQLLTGKLPFEGETVSQILLMQITRAPEPFAERLGMPKGLEQIVFKAIEKDREKRYQSADDFRKDCVRALELLKDGGTESRELLEHLGPEGATNHRITPPAIELTDAVKILCLDDDPTALSFLRYVLEQEGYTVYTTSDCSGIHQLLISEQVKYMICDLRMPGLPGTKVCKMIKESFPDVRIVFYSCADEDELKQKALESKADGWVTKLLSPQRLLDTVEQMVRGESMEAENQLSRLRHLLPH